MNLFVNFIIFGLGELDPCTPVEYEQSRIAASLFTEENAVECGGIFDDVLDNGHTADGDDQHPNEFTMDVEHDFESSSSGAGDDSADKLLTGINGGTKQSKRYKWLQSKSDMVISLLDDLYERYTQLPPKRAPDSNKMRIFKSYIDSAYSFEDNLVRNLIKFIFYPLFNLIIIIIYSRRARIVSKNSTNHTKLCVTKRGICIQTTGSMYPKRCWER